MEVAKDDVGSAKARRKKAFALADELGLSRADRIELAQTLLWRDLDSWQHLSDEQVGRLLDAMEGWVLISHLLQTSPVREAKRSHPSSRASTA